MASDEAYSSQPFLPAEQPTTAELIEELTQFDGAPQEFLLNLLAVQCRVAPAQGGAVFRAHAAGRLEKTEQNLFENLKI